MKITKDTATYWEIDKIWTIKKSDGEIQVYVQGWNDKLKIPQELYDLRDQLMFNNK